MVTIPDTPEISILNPEWYRPYVEQVDMLRLDMLHPEISGNKWFKLKHNIEYTLNNGCHSILTFGGGFSNHLTATAAATKIYGLKSIGIVRGVYETLTPSLQFCVDNDMKLYHVSQEDYKRKSDPSWLHELYVQLDMPYIIAEGGDNEAGKKGAEEIATFITDNYTHICVSVGTGTTMTGIINGLNNAKQWVLGYAPMKGGSYLSDAIRNEVKHKVATKWQLFDAWHFGGFGKNTTGLIDFMNVFHQQNHIPLDVVYTAKMMYGLQQQMQSGFFPANSKILCVHTGGLQGNTSVAGRLVY